MFPQAVQLEVEFFNNVKQYVEMHLLEEGKSERKEEERGRATGRKHPQPFKVHLNGGHLHLATVLVFFS